MTRTYPGPVIEYPGVNHENKGDSESLPKRTYVIALLILPTCVTTACVVQRCPSVMAFEFR